MLEDRQKSSWTSVEFHWDQGNKDQKAVQMRLDYYITSHVHAVYFIYFKT